MSIKIRKATADDKSFIAQMILQSSRAEKKICIYDLIFNTNDDAEILKNLEKLTTTNAKNSCHYTNFLLAEVDGQLVGSLCTYEPRISTRQAFCDSLKELGIENAADSEYIEIMNACDFNLNTRTLVFDFMEEVEGFIDVGVMKELMRKSLLTARLKGYSIAQTVVEIGSLEALLYYKKLGFKEIESKECELYREKFGRPGLVLLTYEF